MNVTVRRNWFGGCLWRTAVGLERLQNNISIYVAEQNSVMTIEDWNYVLSVEDSLMLAGPAQILLGPDLIAVDIVCR